MIHSSRGVGFTGWIGGIAVFDRALSEPELLKLAELRHGVLDLPKVSIINPAQSSEKAR